MGVHSISAKMADPILGKNESPVGPGNRFFSALQAGQQLTMRKPLPVKAGSN
jgi:hypothetical protein